MVLYRQLVEPRVLAISLQSRRYGRSPQFRGLGRLSFTCFVAGIKCIRGGDSSEWPTCCIRRLPPTFERGSKGSWRRAVRGLSSSSIALHQGASSHTSRDPYRPLGLLR